LAEIKRDGIKTNNMERRRKIRKYNTEEKESLFQAIKDLNKKRQQNSYYCLDG
jgi:hypothetical protein